MPNHGVLETWQTNENWFAPMQIQAEPGRPPGELGLPPQDVEPVLHELLSPLWINFEKSCKKAKKSSSATG